MDAQRHRSISPAVGHLSLWSAPDVQTFARSHLEIHHLINKHIHNMHVEASPKKRFIGFQGSPRHVGFWSTCEFWLTTTALHTMRSSLLRSESRRPRTVTASRRTARLTALGEEPERFKRRLKDGRTLITRQAWYELATNGTHVLGIWLLVLSESRVW